MKHMISALIVAAILIVGGGVLVAGVTSSSVGKVGQPRQDIDPLSGERLGTDLTDVSTQVTSGEVTSITDTATLMPAAATTTLVQAGSGEVAPGASITVPVTAEGVPAASPLGAATIEVSYDPSVLDATACNVDPNAIFDSGLCNPDFDDDGIDPDAVRFNATSVLGVSGDLLLTNITFEAVGQPGDTSVLNVAISAFADPDGNPIPVAGQDGQICLTPCATPSPTPSPTPTDSDGDGFANDEETARGSIDTDAGSTPEVCDDAVTDEDGDGLFNEGYDYLPLPSGNGVPDCTENVDTDGDLIPNPSDTDDDNDGFSDIVENWTATNSLDGCADTTTYSDEWDDKWAPDADDTRTVNILDVLKFKPAFGAQEGDIAWRRRFDLDASGAINILDILKIKPHFGTTCPA